MEFSGSSFDAEQNTPFKIGTITYHNGSNTGSAASVELDITVDVEGDDTPVTLDIPIAIFTTPNTNDPIASADTVSFGEVDQSFHVDGLSFHVEEGDTATADIMATIADPPDPHYVLTLVGLANPSAGGFITSLNITGVRNNQAVSTGSTLSPFAEVSIADSFSTLAQTLTVALSAAANGTLSNLGGGSYNAKTGIYTVRGNATAVSAALDGLVFTPTTGQVAPGHSVTTGFTITDTDSDGATVNNDALHVVATVPIVESLSISGTKSAQPTSDQATLTPFAGVTIADAVSGLTETLTVMLSAAANGTLSNLGGGSYDATTGVYTVSGSVAVIDAALDGLIFTPTTGQVAPGQAVTTGFTITDTNSNSASLNDTTTSVVATAPIVESLSISGTAAGQAVSDQKTIAPFSGVTIADSVPGLTETLTVTLSAAANGTLSHLGGGSYDAATGVYTVSGSVAVIDAALDGLAFTPTAGQVTPGQTVTTGFTVRDSNSHSASLSDSTTSVIATAAPVIARVPPVITAPTALTVGQAQAAAIYGIQLAEAGEIAGETYTVTLTDVAGLLSATGAGVTGSGTRNLSITGSLGQVNAELLTLHDKVGSAADTITVHASDSLGGTATPVNTAVTVVPASLMLPQLSSTSLTLLTGSRTLTHGESDGTVRLEGTAAAAPTAVLTFATLGSSAEIVVGDRSGAAHFGRIEAVALNTNGGTLAAEGGSALHPSQLTLGIENVLSANATVAQQGVLDNTGTIEALDGATISIMGDAGSKLINSGSLLSSGIIFIHTQVTGSGRMVVDAGGAIETAGAVSTGQTVFQNAGGGLTIDDLAGFAATIDETASGGRIEFGTAQAQPDGLRYVNGRLALLDGGTEIGALRFHRADGTALDAGSFQLVAASGGHEGYLQITPHMV